MDDLKKSSPRSVSRRELLRSGVLLTSVLATGRLRAAPESVDVVVIGGGIAGLTAAITLADEGARVLVLEADKQVGGRMRSFASPIGTLNPGATTVGPLYARVRNFSKRFGVELKGVSGRAGMGIYVGNQLMNSADWESADVNPTVGAERALHPRTLENRLLTTDLPLRDPFQWLQPSSQSLDRSLADYLRGIGASPGALSLIDITINANNLEQASALMYLRDVQRLAFAMGDAAAGNRSLYEPGSSGSFAYIEGGTNALPIAMAAHLGDRVRLGDPVLAVEQSAKGLAVSTRSGARFDAAQLVCAVPLAVVGQILWRPALAGELGRLVYTSNNTSTAHVYFAVEKPYWEDDIGEPGLFTDSALERVFPGEDQVSGEVTYLDCWINGRAARQIDTLPEADLPRYATDLLNRMRPATKGKVRFAAAYSWGRNPYIRGNKHEWLPGQVAKVIAAMEAGHWPHPVRR